MSISNSIHVAVRCDFCGTHNEVTAKDVAETQLVHCSHCGGVLGEVGRLRDKPVEARRLEAVR
jgi:hypothetical protein